MKKIIIYFNIFFFAAGLFAYDIAEEELLSVKRGSVEFLNYEGPHSKIETREEIKGIGKSLGKYVNSEYGKYNFHNKYTVIHSVDPNETGAFDSDIFIIEKAAQIDHINNIRLVLAGYLEVSYNYSQEDAFLLAEFATYYNAVYRGNMEFFNSRYKKVVLRNITEKNAGLSTRYNDWPGKTRMLIPLVFNKADGTLGLLSTDELTGKEVIEDLRTKEGMGIRQRKDITELKEREVEEQQQRIEAEKQRLADTEAALLEEQKAIEDEKESIEHENETEKVGPGATELKERETRLTEDQQEVAERRELLEEEERTVEQRQERIREEREQIASDERAITAEAESSESTIEGKEKMITIPFLKIKEVNGEYLGGFFLVYSDSGDVETESKLKTVRGRKYYIFKNDFLVIAGIEGGGRTTSLMLLDSKNLKILKKGTAQVYKNSIIKIENNNIYAVVQADDNWVIGKFNKDLELDKLSETQVAPYTLIIVSKGNIYAQNESGEIIILDENSLENLIE